MGESLVSDGQDLGAMKFFLSKFQEGDQVWVKGNKDTIWDLGKIVAAFEKSDDNTVVVKTKRGRDVVTRKAFGGEEIPVAKGRVGYSDMTAMRFVNEPQILENLKVRSYENEPYTFLGPVLVAVNPMEELPNMKAIQPGNKRILNTPHPFAIAELSLQQMQFAVKRQTDYSETPTNQTVIVSGESGAGKTVSSKLVLQHLVARSGGGDLAQAMLGSNPITESFGNAKTLRNHNSSRFGKMFKVMYDDAGNAIVGAAVGTYLLERSRVTKHEPGERNFHVFYEILAGADDKMLNLLHLDRDTQYEALLPKSGKANRKMLFLDYDKGNFELLMKSLSQLGFDESRSLELMQAVAAVLHLNNVVFDALVVDGNDASKVSDATKQHFDWACELLGVGSEDAEKVFTQLQRKVANQTIVSSVSASNAHELLEGVAKSLYARIFEYMIMNVNNFVNTEVRDDMPTIGVLDIFGFETFQRNDLEQLLINYTNEALQLTFNRQVLEAEASLYEREGLAMSEQDKANLDPSQVIDESNKRCIDLLQGVKLKAEKGKKPHSLPGILDVIHEQGRIPSPSEVKLIEKLHKTFATKQNLYPNYMVIKKKARTEFIVKHYAGRVTYTVGNFLIKNVDSLPKTASELFLSSVKESTKAIWDAGSRLHMSKKSSIVSTFKTQIQDLTTDLNVTQCSFIRCMKPNAEMHKNKGWFNAKYVTVQLRNLSVPKTADVLKAGLPTRIAYDQLVERYREIFGGKIKVPSVDDERGVKGFIAALFYAFETPRSCYKLGLTKVFFKSGDLDKLEEILSAADSWVGGKLSPSDEAERERIIQRYKSYINQRRWKVIFATMFAGRMFTKLLIAQRELKELRRNSAVKIQSLFRMIVQRKKYRAIIHAIKLKKEEEARKKAEEERKERERLARIAAEKAAEAERILREVVAKNRERERKEKEKYNKMMAKMKKSNADAAKLVEAKKLEKARREAAEAAEREEQEKKRIELEKLQKEREEEERLAAEAAERERLAQIAYNEKLAREEAQREAQRIKDEAERERLKQIAEEKMQRNMEKMKEKQVMEKVVEEIMKIEEQEHKPVEAEVEDDNPWYFHDDLDFDDINTADVNETDAARINEALNFLDNLMDDDSDDESDLDSDLDEGEEERRYQMARQGNQGLERGQVHEYNGPFIVQVHMTKLDENSAKKKNRFRRAKLTNWKECFAFIYPTHKRVLLHHGENVTTKLSFNSRGNPFPAVIKREEVFHKKQNCLQVVGVRNTEKDDPDAQVSRTLIISFQDGEKRDQFAALMAKFVEEEGVMAPVEVEEPGENAVPVNRPPKQENRRSVLRALNYTRMALLKRANVKQDKMMDILVNNRDDDDEDEELENTDQLVACVNCSEAILSTSASCPRCGALQE